MVELERGNLEAAEQCLEQVKLTLCLIFKGTVSAIHAQKRNAHYLLLNPEKLYLIKYELLSINLAMYIIMK